jgi:hypothetical protein
VTGVSLRDGRFAHPGASERDGTEAEAGVQAFRSLGGESAEDNAMATGVTAPFTDGRPANPATD